MPYLFFSKLSLCFISPPPTHCFCLGLLAIHQALKRKLFRIDYFHRFLLAPMTCHWGKQLIRSSDSRPQSFLKFRRLTNYLSNHPFIHATLGQRAHRLKNSIIADGWTRSLQLHFWGFELITNNSNSNTFDVSLLKYYITKH